MRLINIKILLRISILCSCLFWLGQDVSSAAPLQQTNLFYNPSFEEAGARSGALAWDLSYMTDASPITGADFLLADGGLVQAASIGAPPRDGLHVYHMAARNYMAINAFLKQGSLRYGFDAFENIDTNHTHTVSVAVYPIILEDNGNGLQPAAMDNVHLTIQVWDGEKYIESAPQTLINQAWQDVSLTFLPLDDDEITITFNFLSHHPHAFNGIALDAARFYSNAPVAVPPTATPPPTALPQPTADFAAYDAQQTATAQALQPASALPTAASVTDPNLQVAQVETPAQAAAPSVVSDDDFALPPLDADGKMYYTVQAGDTLQRIARLNCGDVTTCVDTIKALNGLNNNIVQLGQRLIVGPLDDNPVQQAYLLSLTPQATAATVATATLASTIAPTVAAVADVTSPTPAPIAANSSVCVTVFDDTNGDGAQQSSEGSVDGIRVRVIDVANRGIVGEALTSTAETQLCFDALVAGQYKAVIKPTTNYAATTLTEWDLELVESATEQLAFGVQSTALGQGVFQLPTDIPIGFAVACLLGVALFAVTVLALVYGLLRRRSPINDSAS